MTVEVVDFSNENGGSFHSYVNVYQRVSQKNMSDPKFLGTWLEDGTPGIPMTDSQRFSCSGQGVT